MSHIWKYDDYSNWSKQLALNYTIKEIEKKLNVCNGLRDRLSKSHLAAIEKTHSNQSNSQRRAQSRNSMIGNYEEKSALENALEIYCYYPEKTKKLDNLPTA